MKTILLLFVSLFPSALLSQSVADAARANRLRGAKTTTQRVFTDDDVKPGDPNQQASVPTLSDDMEKAKTVLSETEGMTERQYAETIVHDINFPGREDWTNRMWTQEKKVLTAGHVVLDTVSSKSSDAVIRSAKYAFDIEVIQRDTLKVEGIGKASAWERQTRR